MFETGSVRANGARSGGTIGLYFRFFFKIKIYCVFSLESPHGGDSNANTQCTIFNTKKKKKKKKKELWIFFQGSQEQVELAVVNEPSVFEPLTFYCNLYQKQRFLKKV